MNSLVVSYLSLSVITLINKKNIWHIAILILAILFSTRNELVPDTDIYILYYEDPITEENLLRIENGFLYTCSLFHDVLDFSFSYFIFFTSFIFLELWAYTSKLFLGNKGVMPMMLLLFSFYGFFYFGIVIRNAWALVFIYIGFYFLLNKDNVKKRLIFYYVCIIVAFLFHRSAIFFIFFPLFNKCFSNIVYWIWMTSIILLFGMTTFAFGGLAGLLSRFEGFDKLLSYTENISEESSVSLIFVFTFLLAIFLILFKDKIQVYYRKYFIFFLNVCLFGLTLYSLTSKLSGVNRFAQSFFFFSFISVYLLIYYNRQIKNLATKTMILFLFSFINLAMLYHCHEYLFIGYE